MTGTIKAGITIEQTCVTTTRQHADDEEARSEEQQHATGYPTSLDSPLRHASVLETGRSATQFYSIADSCRMMSPLPAVPSRSAPRRRQLIMRHAMACLGVGLCLCIAVFGHARMAHHEDERFLRGGSYSRGGGSYNRGGSSSYNSRTNNRSSNYSNRTNSRNGQRNSRGMSTMGKVLGGLAIAGLGLALMAMFIPAVGAGLVGCGAMCLPACLAGACCGLFAANAAGGSNKIGSVMNGGGGNQHTDPTGTGGGHLAQQDHVGADFEECARRAKFEVEGNSAGPPQQGSPAVPPFSGQYSTSFVDTASGVAHNATLCLNFTPDFQGNGFKISGEGNDIDGHTVIEDGHANHDGSAWWRERTISGDVGLQVLSRGRFDFQRRTFQGTWLSSTMVKGTYISFAAGPTDAHATHAQSHFQQSSYPPTQVGLQAPLTANPAPVVVGVVEHQQPTIPVVAGTVIQSSAGGYTPPPQKNFC